MAFSTINPTNGAKIKDYEELSTQDISLAIDKTYEAFRNWKQTDFSFRQELMSKAADILESRSKELADLMALEMGKPINQGISEAKKCAWVCRYYAENAEKFLDEQNIKTEMSRSYVSFQPIGPVLAIMPWNFPFWQVFRFAAPALMAGNAGLLKHSRNTMGSAIEIERIFIDAGFPENLFTNLVIGSSHVENVIKNPKVAAVTLTGSTPVGSKVAELAGKMIKKTVLELGGSDPYVILEDADIEQAAEICATARLINSGQSCIAAKRFIVVEDIADEFTKQFTEKMKSKQMGDPMLEITDIGPQARKDLQLDLDRQVNDSVKLGAKILCGGKLPEGDGFYYPATVLSEVKKGMPAYDEEIFGPVAAVIKAKDEKEAIAIANDTIFGLGGAVFTQDIERGNRIARDEINSGSVFVNDFVKSDPRLPFGGVMQSGYGRELSEFGIHEFVNIKTICIK